MPFGLTNASTAFQQFINDIFSNLLNICVVINLDNMFIYLKNMSKYYQHVKEVLKHLHKAGLYAKAEKYKFHSKLVEYLKYILFPSDLTISNNKVKDIQSFLGFANFYYWFIFNYLDIIILLIYLIWKDIP